MFNRMDSNDIMVVVDKNVIVPHYHHLTSKNGWLKYDHRVMYKKYTTSLPVWPDKNRQMSIKVAKNGFTRKMNDFDTFTVNA